MRVTRGYISVLHIIILWTLGSFWLLNNLDQNVPVVGYRYLVTYPRIWKKYQRRGHAGWFLALIFVRRYVYNCLWRVSSHNNCCHAREIVWLIFRLLRLNVYNHLIWSYASLILEPSKMCGDVWEIWHIFEEKFCSVET